MMGKGERKTMQEEQRRSTPLSGVGATLLSGACCGTRMACARMRRTLIDRRRAHGPAARAEHLSSPFDLPRTKIGGDHAVAVVPGVAVDPSSHDARLGCMYTNCEKIGISRWSWSYRCFEVLSVMRYEHCVMTRTLEICETTSWIHLCRMYP